MPVVDYGNNMKVSAIKKLNAAKKKLSRDILSNTGKNAGKLTIINKRTLPEAISDSIKQINEAIENGEFYALINGGKFKKQLADYYRKKDYLVFYKVSDSSGESKSRWYGSNGDILVSWIGCKNWVKARELKSNDKTKIVDEAYIQLKGILNEEWEGETITSPNINMKDWLDPKKAKNTLSRFINKL